MKRSILISILCGIVSSSLGTLAPSFQGLGDLSGGNYQSVAIGISADGSTVVGYSNSASGQEAFLSKNGSMIGLGDLPGGTFSSSARDVSADGSVVVGRSTPGGYEAFLWNQTDSMVGLGELPGGPYLSNANAVSSNGSIVVGYSHTGTESSEAFRWEGGSMLSLGSFLGHQYNEGTGISADGTVILGRSTNGGSYHGFYWKDGAMTALSDGDNEITSPYDVSDDGSVIVGRGNTTEASIWNNGEIINLGYLNQGDDNSTAYAVSGDGKTVVGNSASAGPEAFIWDTSNGMRNLKSVLEVDYGLDLTGWFLKSAAGISSDGLTIAGSGINPDGYSEAWVVTIPEPMTLSLLALGGLILRRRR